MVTLIRLKLYLLQASTRLECFKNCSLSNIGNPPKPSSFISSLIEPLSGFIDILVFMTGVEEAEGPLFLLEQVLRCRGNEKERRGGKTSLSS